MILVGGGNGFIGRRLVSRLKSVGQRVMVISRTSGADQITWTDVERAGLPDGVKAVVNLSGRNILEVNPLLANPNRYAAYKREVLDSRVVTTDTLVRAMHAANPRPTVLVNASAIGYYDPMAVEPQDESSPFGDHGDYLGPLMSNWEQAAFSTPSDATEGAEIRRAVIRIGIVLGREGGVLQRTYLPFKLGLGGRLGSGKQWFPWVHIDDLAELFRFAIFNTEISGVLNGVAPNCVTNEEFTKAFGRAVNRPTPFPVPEFALRLLYGERSLVVMHTPKVIPKRTLELGFQFKFPTIDAAMQDLVGR